MFNSNYGSVLHLFDMFDFEKYCNYEIWIRGHWRLFKLVPFNSCLWFPV